ncbi:arginase family protein [Actinocrispum wychmicini]|uniref:Arginase n=1 Tax=Actinocrispum wychmicini TaxID=1213861 RepID=A0A4R2JKE5_9PSEU|nr:arginase family protein [Actinocrispum wychmicini]TCO57019.1 arginase [Actinocrispum wychmicini]
MQIHAVPQRQGAVVERSRLLPDACLALAQLAGDIAYVKPYVVSVASTTSPVVDGIANRVELIANRSAQLEALEAPEGSVLTIGGDCAVEVAPIGVARFRHGEGLGVHWFDAHPDLNTPSTSPSGAFHGMALRALFGEGDPSFAAKPALRHAVLVGARSIDDGERAALALVGTTGECAYVHVDLDVLEPTEFDGACYPEPDGLSVAEVAAAIQAIPVPVVGAGITECATTDPHRLRLLTPILEAVITRLTG